MLEYIENKLIRTSNHPTEDLIIYNYTQLTQYTNHWDEVTKSHRGLIKNSNGVVLNNPLPKFFNLDQLPDREELIKKPFKVYEKLDGNCGILYWLADGTPQIATRGSFTSDGANFANKVLVPKYREYLDKLDKKYTYVFEIISPVTKIVVNYGSQERLVLLAVRANDGSHELDIADVDFPDKAKLYEGWSMESILATRADNTTDEGIILLFEDGFRCKIKYDEYVRLHKIMTNINNIDIWKGKMYEANPNMCHEDWQLDITKALENVPDEFFNWIKKVDSDIESAYQEILGKATEVAKQYADRTAQDIAREVDIAIKGYVFSIYNNKSETLRYAILKNLRPNAETPYVIND